MNTIITETTEDGDIIAIDVFQKLADSRILFITDDITDEVAADICATLILKDQTDEGKISIFINSRGGDIRNALVIYDTMRTLRSPVETICVGSAMKEAAMILAAGTPGLRYATKHSIISVGQLVSDWTQQADLTEAKIVMANTLNDNKKMMDIFAKTTKKTTNQVMKDFERLVFMDSNKAKKYGLIDKIVHFNKTPTVIKPANKKVKGEDK